MWTWRSILLTPDTSHPQNLKERISQKQEVGINLHMHENRVSCPSDSLYSLLLDSITCIVEKRVSEQSLSEKPTVMDLYHTDKNWRVIRTINWNKCVCWIRAKRPNTRIRVPFLHNLPFYLNFIVQVSFLLTMVRMVMWGVYLLVCISGHSFAQSLLIFL